MASLDSNYILENIQMLDDDSITIESLVDKMCIKICTDYNIQRTEELEESIKNILTKYKNKIISSDDVISFFNEIDVNSLTEGSDTSQSSGSSNDDNESDIGDQNTSSGQNTRRSTQSQNDDSNRSTSQSTTPTSETTDSAGIIDVDTDTIEKVSASLSEVEEEASSNNITVPSSVAEYAAELETLAKAGNIEINSSLGNIKNEMLEKLHSIIDTDDSINNDTVADSFASIWATAHNINLTKLVPANESFFKQNPDCKINGNLVT